MSMVTFLEKKGQVINDLFQSPPTVLEWGTFFFSFIK
jgi:hypothetical protein